MSSIITSHLYSIEAVSSDFNAVTSAESMAPQLTFLKFTQVYSTQTGGTNFIVPSNLASTTIQVKAWGAGGGAGYTKASGNTGGAGGGGGFATANISVSKGETLNILVGGGGVAGGQSAGTVGSNGGGGGGLNAEYTVANNSFNIHGFGGTQTAGGAPASNTTIGKGSSRERRVKTSSWAIAAGPLGSPGSTNALSSNPISARSLCIAPWAAEPSPHPTHTPRKGMWANTCSHSRRKIGRAHV